MIEMLKKYLKLHGEEYYEEVIKKPCVSCGHKTPHRLVHKETKDEYPFCLKCRRNGFYNEEIFDIKNHRE